MSKILLSTRVDADAAEHEDRRKQQPIGHRAAACTHRPISGRLSTSSIRLPIHMLAIRPQNSAGCSVITCGPGRDALDHQRADHQRHGGLDGMPSVSIGMNEVCAPALLADFGAATPWMSPLPNSRGVLAIFFSSM